MSFRTNLQYLRAERHMTQEQLAMLLGVSRQSVTKWEAEKSYPEMDKLIKMCQIFECSLDDLVQGDLTGRAPVPVATAVPSGPRPMSAATTSTCAQFAKRIAYGCCSHHVLGVVGLASYSRRRSAHCAACSIAEWQQAGASYWVWRSVRRRVLAGRRHLGLLRYGAFRLCEGPSRSSRISTQTRTVCQAGAGCLVRGLVVGLDVHHDGEFF